MHVKITAKLMAKMHLVLALVWAILTIPTLLWWKNSILWVSLMSIYAIVISHLAAYSAAHAEKAASKAMLICRIPNALNFIPALFPKILI